MQQYLKPQWVQAILLGMGTVAGAMTFWYTDIYKPAATPATLTITPALETIGRSGDDLLVRAALRIENRSGYRVYVPAFWYTVHGYCYQSRALTADSYATAVGAWREGGVQSRFNERARGALLVTGRPSPRMDSYFDPGSERRYEELFLVPRDRYGALRMEVTYMVAKTLAGIDTTRWQREPNGDVGDRVYINRRALARNGLGWSATAVSERYNRVAHRRWARRARAGWGWSHASLSLWPLDAAGPSGAPATCAAEAARG